MNNNQCSISDFRYLNPTLLSDRVQIERELLEMGTAPEVISWFFSQLDELKAEYIEHLSAKLKAKKTAREKNSLAAFM